MEPRTFNGISNEYLDKCLTEVFQSHDKWPEFPSQAIRDFLEEQGLSDIRIINSENKCTEVSGIDDFGEEWFMDFEITRKDA